MAIKRHLMITLTPDQATMIERWMQAEGCTSPQTAIRSLLSMALSSMPEDGMEHARAMRAYYETREWVMRRVVDNLATIQGMLEQTLKDNARARSTGTYR